MKSSNFKYKLYSVLLYRFNLKVYWILCFPNRGTPCKCHNFPNLVTYQRPILKQRKKERFLLIFFFICERLQLLSMSSWASFSNFKYSSHKNFKSLIQLYILLHNFNQVDINPSTLAVKISPHNRIFWTKTSKKISSLSQIHWNKKSPQIIDINSKEKNIYL